MNIYVCRIYKILHLNRSEQSQDPVT